MVFNLKGLLPKTVTKRFPSPKLSGKTSILTGTLLLLFIRKFGKDLTVDVDNPCTFYVGGKAKELHFQEEQIARPQLRKSNAQNLILFWPIPRSTEQLAAL